MADLSVDQARQTLFAWVQPVTETESVALADSVGRVLAQPLIAAEDSPSFDNSAMDGYAFKADQRTERFDLVGESLAGVPWRGHLAPAQACYIATGGALPSGADTVVAQEQAQLEAAAVLIAPQHHRPGQHVRRRAEDYRAGEPLLAPGRQLRPWDVGLIASQGHSQVEVYRRLKVALLATGEELRQPGQQLEAGSLYDSNRPMLAAWLSSLGVDLIGQATLGDRLEDIRAWLTTYGASADVILSVGGVSVGKADLLRPLLDELGQLKFWRIAMKPGRPLACGRIGSAWFFGLPGNPVSAVVTFQQLVEPSLRRLAGVSQNPAWEGSARLAQAMSSHDRQQYCRVRLEQQDGQWWAYPLASQSSAALLGLSQADALAVIPANTQELAAGSTVCIYPL